MNTHPGPDLKRSAALSLVVHLILFTSASALLSKTTVTHPPPLYSVTLVADDIGETGEEETINPAGASVVSEGTSTAKKGEKDELDRHLSSRLGEIKARGDEKRYVSERLSALRAKAHNAAANVKNTTAQGNQSLIAAGRRASGVAAAVCDDYSRKVNKRIRREWVYLPETAGLEAVVSITVLKDGSIRLNRIEKSSGNPNFDRSALRAINRASPLAPPPWKECEEVEIGFSP